MVPTTLTLILTRYGFFGGRVGGFTRKHTHSISKKSHESSVFMRQQSHCHLYHLCLFHFMLYSKSHKLMI